MLKQIQYNGALYKSIAELHRSTGSQTKLTLFRQRYDRSLKQGLGQKRAVEIAIHGPTKSTKQRIPSVITCNVCGKTKKNDQFKPHAASATGHAKTCKKCSNTFTPANHRAQWIDILASMPLGATSIQLGTRL